MKHLSSEELSAHLDRALRGRAAQQAERHLASCQACREALAALAAQDESLRPALTSVPDEAYFESFPERVTERIRGSEPALAGKGGWALSLGRRLGSPRALRWAGAVAVMVVGAGIAVISVREVRSPDLKDRDLTARLEQRAVRQGEAASPGEPGRASRVAAPAEPSAGPEAGRPSGAREGATGAQAPVVEEKQVPPVAQERGAQDPERESRADDFAARRAPAATPSAPANARAASPGRAYEVRRTESGEEVPVRPPAARFAAPPPRDTEATDQVQRVRKKTQAEPLEALKTLGDAREGLVGQAKEESAAAPARLALSREPPVGTGLAAEEAGEEVRLCGEVHDPAGRPITGAQVVLTNLGRSAVTDARGRFCLVAPRGEHELSVMAVGYREARERVAVEAGAPPPRITLAAVPVLPEGGGILAGRAARPAPAPPEPQDSYRALSDTLRRIVREAQRLTADAEARGSGARGSAARYDAAAATWERALRPLAGGPLELETRWHLAVARFHAWEAGPNRRRALEAVEALTAYVARAPGGSQRDQAARWLDQVRR